MKVIKIRNKQNLISTLIFSKDDTIEAIDTLNEVYEFSDEVVLIDQSSSKNKKLLLEEKERKHLTKLKVFNTLPFGYVGPIFKYGENKCTSKWILMLDTDEKPNSNFKKNIREFLKKTDASGFYVKLINMVKNKNEIYQESRIKLYKNGTLDYTGRLHDPPNINGKMEILDKNYVITHQFSYEDNPKKLERYFRIESYTDRLTYADILDLSKKRKINPIFIKIYMKLKGVRYDDEISKFEYFTFQSFYLFLVYLTEFRKMDFKLIRFTYRYNIRKFNYFFSVSKEEREEQLAIKNDIRKNGGVIKYLDFDKPKVVDLIYKKYKNSPIKSVDLFVYLLRLRHKFGKYYYKNLNRSNYLEQEIV